jgi:transposase
MKVMARPSKYPVELRERAVRLVAESKAEYPSEFEAIRSIAAKLGIGSPETLRKWVRRANEILKSASAFFAAELDRPSRF